MEVIKRYIRTVLWTAAVTAITAGEFLWVFYGYGVTYVLAGIAFALIAALTYVRRK